SKVYYRLRITEESNKYNYSNVLLIKGKTNSVKGFSIYPNIISSNATVSLNSEKKQQVTLQIADYSGRIVKQQSFSIQEGNNSIQINELNRLSSGNYIVIIRAATQAYNQKIVIR